MRIGTIGRAAIAVAGAFIASGASSAEGISGVLGAHTMKGQPIPCVAEADGIRVCKGAAVKDADLRIKSFDGTPLALYVTLPAAPSSGTDGNYPLVILSHGWGAPPSGPDDGQYGALTAREWAKAGYAAVQLAARGWGDSCGNLPSRFLSPAECENAYIRRVDHRYEVHDAQNVAGLLVDEGIADGKRIGASGESYGGGTSLALATLNDRVMNLDGTLSPWTSPKGTPLHIAAAAPFAGWSDQSLMSSNGRWLDTQTTVPPDSPVGVQRMSIAGGLFLVGAGGAYYPPPYLNADFATGWAVGTAGEPYDNPVIPRLLKDQAQFHSSYHLLAGTFGTPKRQPSPIVFGHGFTDDVFWADQVLLYYNLLRTMYPSAPIEVFFGDIGHQRAQNKPSDGARVKAGVHEFFDHYVKGTGPQPTLGFTVMTQTCPKDAPSGGPYTAATWAALHPGLVTFKSQPAQTINSTAGDRTVSRAFDPVYGGLSCTTVTVLDEGPGVATYRLPTPTGSGYTLLGSPMVTADVKVTGQYAYIAARLVDVDPVAKTKTLVSRGMYRIDPKAPNGRLNFQLYANGWHFAPGHIPQLELLGRDSPFLRPSNGEFSIAVSNLELKLPVHDVPGADGTAAEVVRAARN